jgi:cation diffusion facilitator family transporter
MHGFSHSGSKSQSARNGVIAGFIDLLVTLSALAVASSSVLLADSLKTFLEFVAVLLAWMAMRRIEQGASHHFNYGVDKLENLSSLLIGILMLICLLIIGGNAVLHIIHPSGISGPGVWISMAVQVVYAGVNGRFYLKNKRMAKAQASPLLESQSRLFFTKAFGNVFILLSLISSLALAEYSWSHYIDPLASLIIAASILVSAMGIFSSSVFDLLDKSLEESDQIIIMRELALHFDDFDTLHGIRTRRAGSQAFVDIYLEFAPEKTIAEVQPVIDHLRISLEAAIQGAKVTIGLTTRPEN